jgi:hypothetical protein
VNSARTRERWGGEKIPERAWRVVPGVVALVVVVSALWGRVVLYADGSIYLYWILRRCTFYWSSYEHFFSRSEAQIITQAPLRLALELHIYPLPWLIGLYGVGLFVFPNALWMLAIYRQRDEQRFWYFTALYLVTLCAQFYAVSESLLTYALVALAASLILGGDPPNSRRAWAVAIISLALVASYEVTLILSPLLGVLLLGWWWCAGGRRTGLAVTGPLALALAALGASTALAFITIRSHAESAGPTTALSLHFLLAGGYAVLVATLVVGALAATVYLSGWWRLAVLASAALAVLVLLDPHHWAAPNVAYDARVYVGVVLAGGLLLVTPRFVFGWGPRPSAAPEFVTSRLLVSALAILLTVSFAANAEGFGAWNKSLQRIVTTHHGVLPFFSGLGPSVPQFSRYGWLWTTPEQSLLDQTHRHQAVVNNPNPSEDFEITPGVPSSYLSPRYFG